MLLPIIISYLLGSIPSAYIVGKLNGIDLGRIGSGNYGGTNVYRALGIKWALLVGFIDSFKGFLSVYFFGYPYLIPCVLGHAFSIWIKFRGGKGVASTLGGTLAYALRGNWAPFIFLALTALFVFLLTRIASLSSLTSVFSSTLSFYYTDYSLFPFSFALFLLILFLHRSNIKRLIKGEEKRVSRVRV